MERNYTITIKNETQSDEQNPVAGQGAGSDQAGSGDSSKPVWVKRLVALNHYVKPFVEAGVNHHIQTIALRTGATEYQQRVQFAYNVIKQGVGIVENIAVGAAVGNAPGAIIGAVIGIATSVISYTNRAKELYYQQNLEDVSLRGMITRAGGYMPSYAGSRSGRQ